jgi:hypothetical protein
MQSSKWRVFSQASGGAQDASLAGKEIYTMFDKTRFATGLLLMASAHYLPAQTTGKIDTDTLKPGMVSVSSTAPAASRVFVNGEDQGAVKAGPFQLQLKRSLMTGDIVTVQAGSSKTLTPAAAGTALTPATAGTEVTANTAKLKIGINDLYEADTTVSGTITGGDLKSVTKVTVDVHNGGTAYTLVATFDQKTGFSAKTAGLREGQTVHVSALDTDDNVLEFGETRVKYAGFDWGRVRGFFSVGGVAARSGDHFANPDPYLALNVGYTVLTSRKLKTCGTESGEEAAATLAGRKNENQACAPANTGGRLLNSYFEGRLTQVPQQLLSGATAASGSTAATATSPTLSQTSGGGYVEGGMYAPFYSSHTRWSYSGNDQAIFLAPIFKMGFEVTGASDPRAVVDAKDVHQFYAGGLRLGHLTMDPDPAVSPDIPSFLDLTVGRWDVYRRPKNGASSTAPPFARPARFDAAGRFKIPATPLFVGFEVNVGSGVDDMRFIFGTRIDVGKVLGRLIPGTN